MEVKLKNYRRTQRGSNKEVERMEDRILKIEKKETQRSKNKKPRMSV